MKEGIIEEVSEGEPTGEEFYLPHKLVIRQSAESTKLRIVFDASARENDRSTSPNNVIEVGAPLQNHMWKVLETECVQWNWLVNVKSVLINS